MGTFTILPSLVSSKTSNWTDGFERPLTSAQLIEAFKGTSHIGYGAQSYLGTDDPKPDGLFTTRLDFFGDCIQLDDVGPLISYAGLPAGFTALSCTISAAARSYDSPPNCSGVVQADPSKQADFIIIGGETLLGEYIYDFVTFPKPTMLDIYANGTGLEITVPSDGFFDGLIISISGTYTLISFTLPTLETPGPLGPGDHVILTSPLVDGLDFTHVSSAYLQFVNTASETKKVPIVSFLGYDLPYPLYSNPSNPFPADSASYIPYTPYAPLSYIPYDYPYNNLYPYAPYVYIPLIAQTETYLEFILPEIIIGDIPSGEVEIIVTGDGTQFSGSLSLGTFTILYENASGIYKIVKDKTSDTIYDRLAGEGETAELKIPNPFVETGYIGG